MTKIIYKSYNKVLVQSPYFIEYINKQGVLKDKIIYYPSYAEDLYLRVDNKKYLLTENSNCYLLGILDMLKILKSLLNQPRFFLRRN